MPAAAFFLRVIRLAARMIAIAALALGLALPATAKVIRQQGGDALLGHIGGWYVFKVWYEDQQGVCQAVSPSYERRMPAFTLEIVPEGPNKGFFISFDVTFTPKPGETVDLIIGKRRIKLVHPKGFGSKRFFPETAKDAMALFALLASQSESKDRYLVVKSRNGTSKHSIRSFAEVIDFIDARCKGL